MATALELADVQKPEYIEFNSLMDLVNEKQFKSKYDAIYGTYEKGSQRMIRKGDYKLIVYPKSQKILLFDLKNDPLEINDLASDPVNSKKLKILLNDLIQLQEDMGDQLDLKSIYGTIL
jgi:arylsulfatase A-like enzyme